MPNTHVFPFTAQKYTHIDLFADTAAIFISIVSNSYYGMPRGQIHINVPPDYHIMCFGTIEIKMAAVSAKRSIHYFLHHQQKLRTSAQAPHQQSLFPDKSTVPCFYTFFSFASSCCLNVMFPGTQPVLACFLRALCKQSLRIERQYVMCHQQKLRTSNQWSHLQSLSPLNPSSLVLTLLVLGLGCLCLLLGPNRF